MSKEKAFVFLKVTTWAGTCVVAEHFYGTLSRGMEEDTFDVTHELTEGEARELNRADRERCENNGIPVMGAGAWLAGNTSGQFISREALIVAAKAQWRTNFPDAEFLIDGESYVSEPQPVIDGNLDDPRIVRLNAMAEERKELDWDRKADVPKLNKNQEEYRVIMKTFEEAK